MAKSSTHQLRVFKEDLPAIPPSMGCEVASLPEVAEAFERLTGCSLRYVADAKPSRSSDLTWSAPVNPGVGATLGHLRLEPVGSAGPGVRPADDPGAVRQLAAALARMLGEFFDTQSALRRREAEMAADVLAVPHKSEPRHLAERLAAVLKGGAEAVGCMGAGLYLLDEATTSLKLRSCWGLPCQRLTLPPRALAGAMADLEAMLGHAVVLSDPLLHGHWNPPEDYPAAICVPISTATTVLGTLWIFSATERDFTAHETNIVEVVAGRLAAELEREILLNQRIAGIEITRQLAAAQRLQRNQLPSVSPLIDGWDLAGWTSQAGDVGGSFFDWFTLADGRVAIAIGNATGGGVEAALSACGVRAAVRSHGQYQTRADALLRQVNLTLWTGSAGDQAATLFYGLLARRSGEILYSSTDGLAAMRFRPGAEESLHSKSPCLGGDSEPTYGQEKLLLQRGEILLVLSGDLSGRAGSMSDRRFAETLAEKCIFSAKELLGVARDCLENRRGRATPPDRAILVIKRTGP